MMISENDRTTAIRPPTAPVARQIAARATAEHPSNATDAPYGAALQRVICNPISGEQIIIRTSGAETNGELLIFDLFLPLGKQVPGRHTHPIQEERFTILAGRLRFRLGWRRILAVPIEVGPTHSLRHRTRQILALARMLLEFQREVAVPDLAAWLGQPILAALAHIDRRSATRAMPESPHGRS